MDLSENSLQNLLYSSFWDVVFLRNIATLFIIIDPDAEAQREDGGADGRAADIGGEQGEGLLLLRGSAAPLREHARITPTRIN